MNADIDTEQLISLVRERPALWDKSREHQSMDVSIFYTYVSSSCVNVRGKGDTGDFWFKINAYTTQTDAARRRRLVYTHAIRKEPRKLVCPRLRADAGIARAV